jgi:hypothetical protein
MYVQPLKVYLYSLYPFFLLVTVVKGTAIMLWSWVLCPFYCDVILYSDINTFPVGILANNGKRMRNKLIAVF